MAIAEVLVVDDDYGHLEIFSELLTRLGHSGTVAASAFLGLRLLESRRFDLVFADVVMPVMDGVEFARRANKIRPDLPIVFVTGYPRQATEMLGNGTLTLFKPLSGQTLENVIQERVR